MLDEKAGGGDVVAVDDQSGVGGVLVPADAVAVVGPPGPDVVEDDVVAVDLQADGGLADVRSTDAEEHVLQGRRVGGSLEPLALAPCAVCRSASAPASSSVPASMVMPAMSTPGTSATLNGTAPLHGGQRREAQAEHDGVGPLDLDRLVDVVDAGGEQQVLAAGELVVDRLSPSRTAWRGRSRTAGSSGRASGRSPMSPTELSVRRAGTKTLYCPAGVDVEVGLLPARPGSSAASCTARRSSPARGSTAAGAPRRRRTPGSRRRSTSRPMLLLRTKNCCCDPLTTVLPALESAMNPPLANCGPVQ